MTDSTTLPHGRARLAAVLKAGRDVVRIEDAANVLNISRTEAAKILSRWAGQGWLRRVGVGTYVPVQLELLGTDQVVEDPWIIVPSLFDPAYIGGWSAAEHWDLTEQIFRDIVVFTARPVRQSQLHHPAADFLLKHVAQERLFGTKSVWRGQTRVAVSNIHRTIIDMLHDPTIGGGIQHVGDCFERYLSHADRDDEKLIAYGDRLGNGAIFKRLGFLAERHSEGNALAKASQQRLTQGHAKLDTAMDCPRLITRWRLRVPESWHREAQP